MIDGDSSDDGKTEVVLYTCHIGNRIYDEKGGVREVKRWLEFGQPKRDSKISGTHDLPPGYSWVSVPWGVKVELPVMNASSTPLPYRPWRSSTTALKVPDGTVEASSSPFQPIAAVVRAISAGITLYRTRGDQIDRYGFASFGFTVVPYLLMSSVNFFAQYVQVYLILLPIFKSIFLTHSFSIPSFSIPKYSALYVVQSDVLDEAARRLGHDVPRYSIVGRLPSEKPSKESPQIKVQGGDVRKWTGDD